ncbi:hypothetical protein PROFUN_10732 [Planoprotostelium fungivorum]|uniref:Mannosyl-oligosaccharide glucosidase n=1 Tax=Planoprotostelium fungivorum TaxID=1890364 RepID=A0A2P6N7X7_9EUKA|nr:hypothetical protein PROFUN_10732 [Planoprotostelium fungivorum]
MKTRLVFILFLLGVFGQDDIQQTFSGSTEAEIYNSTMFWGSYRPNLYFGMKTRSERPFLTGLMWNTVGSRSFYQSDFENMRHTCEQGDNMQRYGWIRHDGQTFGEQEVIDKKMSLNVSTIFVKNPTSQYGGEWSYRVRVTSTSKDQKIVSLYNYFGVDLLPDERLDLIGKAHKGLVDVGLTGRTKDLGNFQIAVLPGDDVEDLDDYTPKGREYSTSKDLTRTLYEGLHVAGEDQLWRVRDPIIQSLRKDQQKIFSSSVGKTEKKKKGREESDEPGIIVPTLSNEAPKGSNMYVFQRVLRTPFQFDVVFTHDEGEGATRKRINLRDDALHGESLDEAIQQRRAAFDASFEEKFHLQRKSFTADQQRFARETFSNLIGGIGFFHGRSKLQKGQSVVEDEARSLFTAVPSRPFFPRGFLWDEGFHQLVIQKWNHDITEDVLKHWFNLMNHKGWIAREQILGLEARSKVPEEFQTQNEEYANPPTMLFTIDRLQKISSGKVLLELLPKLDKWVEWFMRTQKGSLPNTFRWRGRTANHTLTSGLDDYPRADVSDDELHLDLITWMAIANKLMWSISETNNRPYDTYKKRYDTYVQTIEELFWDPQTKAYGDVLHGKAGNVHVVHKGYITLFPFLGGLIPTDSPRLDAILDLLLDPKEVWSPYGIRSLSKSDRYFGTNENYWRGPIWMNINYLVLQSLHNNYIHSELSLDKQPYREKAQRLYNNLRSNLIANVYKVWKETGYVWEQYDPNDGKGQRSHPFTGWTSLIINIMGETY